MSEHAEAAARIADALPVHTPEFAIPVGVVDGYHDMTVGDVSTTVGSEDLPALAARLGRLIIHGYAGSGKTELMHRLFRQVIGEGGHAALVRLRNLSTLSTEWDQLKASPPAQIALLLAEVAEPSVSEALIRTTREPFYLLVDGLDEIRSSLAVPVLRALDDLAARVPNVVIVVTDRFTNRPVDTRRWTIAALQQLDAKTAGSVLHRDPSDVQPLLRVPVFADLILNGPAGADDDLLARQTMIGFIRPYLVGDIGDDMLPAVADAAYDVYASSQSRVFPLDQFAEIAGTEATRTAIDTGAVVVDGANASFAQNLVHDYLAAYSLASHSERWNQDGFDAVSFEASSFDVLVLTAEILAERNEGELIEVFVQQLYDWNFYAVGFVLARCVNIGSEALPPEVYVAVETMLAERRWDRIVSTADKVENALRLIGNPIADQLLALGSLTDLQRWVETQPGGAPWFDDWKELFLTPQGSDVDVEFVLVVRDLLSIRGWTAANVVKRTNPSDSAESKLRSFVRSRARQSQAVRWRAAHALGAFPTPENIDVLFKTLTTDSYFWARYGALRSLVEQASRTDDPDLRADIIERLASIAETIAAQPRLVEELSNCVIIADPPSGWADALRPLLSAMWSAASGEDQQVWDRTVLRLEAITTAA